MTTCLKCAAPSLAIPCQCDDIEWRKLEKERAELWGSTTYNGTRRKAVACGIPYTNKAHPDSYRPDLPLRSQLDSAVLFKTTAAERKLLAKRAPLQVRLTGSAETILRSETAKVRISIQSRLERLRPYRFSRSSRKEIAKLEAMTEEDIGAQAAKNARAILARHADVRKQAAQLNIVFV